MRNRLIERSIHSAVAFMGLTLLSNLLFAQDFVKDFEQVYRTIYERHYPKVEGKINFTDYEEEQSEANFEWSGDFYLNQSEEEGALGLSVVEFGQANIARYQPNRVSRFFPNSELLFGSAEIASTMTLSLFHQLDGKELFRFPLLENLHLWGKLNAQEQSFRQQGEMEQQRTPIVIEGIERGTLTFEHLSRDAIYLFEEQFKALKSEEEQLKISDITLLLNSDVEQVPQELRLSELRRNRFHQYDQSNLSAGFTLYDLHYSAEGSGLTLEQMRSNYSLHPEGRERAAAEFNWRVKNLTWLDDRCGVEGCPIGEIEVQGSFSPLNRINFRAVEEEVSALKSFFAAEHYYDLRKVNPFTLIIDLLKRGGAILTDESELRADLKVGRSNQQAEVNLLIKPSRNLKTVLTSIDERGMEEECASVSCFESLLEQFELTIKVPEGAFAQLFPYYLMQKERGLTLNEAQESARKWMRNLIIAHLLFSSEEFSLFEVSGGGLTFSLFYRDGEWSLNNREIGPDEIFK